MKTFLFSHARTALKYGLQSSLYKKKSTIIIPNYICEVVPRTIINSEFNIRYYKINHDFTPDWDDLNNKLNKDVSAILMVHFFGIQQNVNKFYDIAQKKKILLIEDNAHSLINDNNYNNDYFDFSISSPRKNLNLFSGGSLTTKNFELDLTKISKYPTKPHQTLQKYHNKKFQNIKLILKKNLFRRPKYEDNLEAERPIKDYLIDDYSKKTLLNFDLKILRLNKIKKFNYWNNFALINNLKPIFPNIENDNLCPWCCPVYSNSKEETVHWYKWGWKKGIFVYSWPNLIKESLNDEKLMLRRERLICFSTN